MLGAQTWFTVLGVPTVAVGGYVASRKRLAFQWREELMDPNGNIYPVTTDMQMEGVRRVAPEETVEALAPRGLLGRLRRRLRGGGAAVEEGAGGVQLAAAENMGVCLARGELAPEEVNVLLNEARRWAAVFGNTVDERKVEQWERGVAAERERRRHGGSSDGGPSHSSSVPVEDVFGEMDTDFYRHLRIVSDHAEDIQQMKAPWGCGDALDHSQLPPALRFLSQRVQDTFAGIGRLRHVYVEYSPSGALYHAPRSPKMYDGHDYVVVPLRRAQIPTVVTLSPVLRSRTASVAEVVNHSWTNRDVDTLVPSGGMMRVYGQARYDWGWGLRPGPQWLGSRLNRLSQPKGDAGARDAAVVVLHYEGPRAANKQRSLLLHPESLIYGTQPTAETYEKWVLDRPTADTVHDEGILRFLARNYYSMLTL